MLNPIVRWECNNPDCDHFHIGEFFGETHLPDTDCPKCGWHDSMVEIEEVKPLCGTITWLE